MRVTCKRDRYRYIRLVIRFINEKFSVNHNTNFCVDTGAPYSLISYEQAIEWKLPFDQLKAAPGIQRVGGTEGNGYILENSKILLRDYRGILNPIEIPKILVLGPPFRQKGLAIPPLLGDDILRRFNLIVKSEQHGGEITITDENVEISFSQ